MRFFTFLSFVSFYFISIADCVIYGPYLMGPRYPGVENWINGGGKDWSHLDRLDGTNSTSSCAEMGGLDDNNVQNEIGDCLSTWGYNFNATPLSNMRGSDIVGVQATLWSSVKASGKIPIQFISNSLRTTDGFNNETFNVGPGVPVEIVELEVLPYIFGSSNDTWNTSLSVDQVLEEDFGFSFRVGIVQSGSGAGATAEICSIYMGIFFTINATIQTAFPMFEFGKEGGNLVSIEGTNLYNLSEISGANMSQNVSQVLCRFGVLTVPANFTQTNVIDCISPPQEEYGLFLLEISLNGYEFTESGLQYEYIVPTSTSVTSTTASTTSRTVLSSSPSTSRHVGTTLSPSTPTMTTTVTNGTWSHISESRTHETESTRDTDDSESETPNLFEDNLLLMILLLIVAVLLMIAMVGGALVVIKKKKNSSDNFETELQKADSTDSEVIVFPFRKLTVEQSDDEQKKAVFVYGSVTDVAARHLEDDDDEEDDGKMIEGEGSDESEEVVYTSINKFKE